MSDTQTPQAYNLLDYQTDAPPSAEPPRERVAFTDEKLAEICASLTAFGVPEEALDDYTQAYIKNLKTPLELLGVGDALADLGITNDPEGKIPLPPLARVGLGLGMAALVTVGTRRKYAALPAPVDHRAARTAGYSEGEAQFYE